MYRRTCQWVGGGTTRRPRLERNLQWAVGEMRWTYTISGKAIDLRLFAGRGIRYIACLVAVIWTGAFSALQCKALSIRESLGMMESGNDDNAVGSAGEISRYQIKKKIWRMYSSSSRFWDMNEAWNIAEKVLATRIDKYQRRTGHQPAAFDLYVLWNAPGQFQSVGFEQRRISHVVAERARRFANLVSQPDPTATVAGRPIPERVPPPADRSSVPAQFAAVINTTK